MLMCKIKSVEVVKDNYFTLELKVTNNSGEQDNIIVDMGEVVIVSLCDRYASNYKFKDNTLGTDLVKVSGALAGGVFALESGDVKLQDSEFTNSAVYFSRTGEHRCMLTIGNACVDITKIYCDKPSTKVDIVIY